ncbi:Cell cycle serine/threonine-protein kinase cdc5/MSD2 [Elasticomyces elasticus]|nr:Cell cycle serine/threonine-protein kinase cdc5/MSD2 [Elasticomyces elasticus]
MSEHHAEPPPAVVTEPLGVQYATGPLLGKGGFAICHEAELLENEKPTGQVFALKIVRTKMQNPKLTQKFVTELQIHSKLAHPNIVLFHRAFSLAESTYVVLSVCSNGSLADLLKRRKFLTMPEIRRILIQISGAVKYLHHRNIVHRDLKTGNLFLDENMNVKVGDFGLAALLVDPKDMCGKRRTTMCGTPNYLAPEILDRRGHGEAVDLWAIGCIATSFTLATGRAPFHAGTKEEIYAKAKAREFAWPELAKCDNDISADMRQLVDSIFVSEDLRPRPDTLVSHAFFKFNFIPECLPPLNTKAKPIWPQNVLPTAATITRGYSESWWNICKQLGVGEIAPGQCFPLPGGKRIRSIVRDIEKEITAGRAPTMPIPADSVYVPFSQTVNLIALNGLSDIIEEKESSAEGRTLQETSHNRRRPAAIEEEGEMDGENRVGRLKDAEMMPPPRRMRKYPTIRRTVRTLSEESAKSEPIRIASDDSTSAKSTNPAPIPALAVEKTRRTETLAPASLQTETKQSEPAKVTRNSADPSLARRPRGTRKIVEDCIPAPGTISETSRDEPPKMSKPASKVRRTRANAPVPETVEILGDEELYEALPPSRVSYASSRTLSKAQPTNVRSIIPGSDPATVLSRLRVFHANLANALAKTTGPSRTASRESCTTLPFVSKWVDYSRKHGIGYVLQDGTVGCVVKSQSAKDGPATHVFVRDGQKWLRKINIDFTGLERVPFDFFEDGEKGVERVDLTRSGHSERKRSLGILWVKFGRYMCQTLGEGGMNGPKDTEPEEKGFVRLYQRLGNVGIWVFGDGSLQVNFPDHTKLVFSSDGIFVQATCISTEAAAHVAKHRELPSKFIRDRQTLNQSVHNIAYAAHRGRTQLAELVRANMLKEKSDFLLAVVGKWIEGGGLGCSKAGFEGMQWQGLQVEENVRKIEWVTVGRYGGDENRLAS